MSFGRAAKLVLVAACVLFALTLAASPVVAQCAMCKTSIAGSPDSVRLAERFNFAVFVLLIPPVVLFCGFIVALYKFRKAPGDASSEGNVIRCLLRSAVEKFNARFGAGKRKGAEATARLSGRSIH